MRTALQTLRPWLMKAPFRSVPGTYILWIVTHAPQVVTVGRLGDMYMKPGTYAYVGSAFGPGGMRARVQRHAAGAGTPHWHIDYVRPAGQLLRVWATYDPVRRECTWARVLRALPGATVPMRGVGASDCACPAHLMRWRQPPSLAAFRTRLLAATTAHAPIYVIRRGAARGAKR